jgi:release factor glutamine methyltransferase
LLEIGVGGGGNLSKPDISQKFNQIVGTDIIDLRPIRKNISRFLDIIVTDRAECFRKGTFDVIVFNPPYLPSEGILDRTVDGGKGGIQVPLQFLESALSVLKSEGRVVMLLSSDDSIDEVRNYCENRGFVFKKVAESALFFERLYLFLIQRQTKKVAINAPP